MGHEKPIRLPRLTRVKIHIPKNVHSAAAARLPNNSSLKADISLRYEMLSTQQQTGFGSSGANAIQGLANQAKIFGVAEEITPPALSSPTSSSVEVMTAGRLDGPMMGDVV